MLCYAVPPPAAQVKKPILGFDAKMVTLNMKTLHVEACVLCLMYEVPLLYMMTLHVAARPPPPERHPGLHSRRRCPLLYYALGAAARVVQGGLEGRQA